MEDPTRPGAGAPQPEDDSAWTYRGYRLRGSDFSTAMVHLFRAYVSRADAWRARLDSTTNWAVVTTAAAISITFSDINTSPVVISLCTILVTLFLWIEARRYRYFELWSLRVRLLETDFYAAMLVPPFKPDPLWAESLARSLLTPTFPITAWEAFGRRYRHNYVWIYLVLALAWITHVWVHPYPAPDLEVMLKRAAMGDVPGWAVILLGVVFNGVLLAVGLFTMSLTQAAGEVLDRSVMLDFFDNMEWKLPSAGGPVRAQQRFRPRASQRRPEVLALLITRKGEELGRSMLEQVHRGVTSMPATGMYTGREQSVLVCALTVTEVNRLRQVVRQVDPSALVVTLPVHEVRGYGFVPLENEENEEAGS